jgi:phosphatidate phosphatase
MPRRRGISADDYDLPDLATLIVNLLLLGAGYLYVSMRPLYTPPFDSQSDFPIHPDTVDGTWLAIYIAGSIALGIAALLAGRYYLPDWFRQINPYAALWLFANQVVLSSLIVQVFKFYAGRPRPDMYAYCDSREAQYDTCNISQGTRYNEFESWPSGHSSGAMGSFLFVALLLIEGVNTDVVGVAIVGVVLITFAIWIGATRIRDSKHHPDDVVAGFFVGIVVTALVWYQGSTRIFVPDEAEEDVLS